MLTFYIVSVGCAVVVDVTGRAAGWFAVDVDLLSSILTTEYWHKSINTLHRT